MPAPRATSRHRSAASPVCSTPTTKPRKIYPTSMRLLRATSAAVSTLRSASQSRAVEVATLASSVAMRRALGNPRKPGARCRSSRGRRIPRVSPICAMQPNSSLSERIFAVRPDQFLGSGISRQRLELHQAAEKAKEDTPSGQSLLALMRPQKLIGGRNLWRNQYARYQYAR